MRIGGMLLVTPGLGEVYVAVRTRLMLALALSIVMVNMVTNIPPIPNNLSVLAFIIITEIFVGIFLGMIARMLISAMHVAGMIITSGSGLGMAILFDPTQGTQGAVIGNFLGNITICLLFITNMHHIIIQALADSYQLFIPGNPIIMGDSAATIVKLAGESFAIGVKFAAPQIVLGLILMLCSGVLSRLMPAVQIFFLVTPIQLLFSFFVLMLSLSGGMMWYMNNISDTLTQLVMPK